MSLSAEDHIAITALISRHGHLVDAGDHISARSKGIAVNADGSSGSVTYVDTVAARPEGWRITHRRGPGPPAPAGRLPGPLTIEDHRDTLT